MKTIVFHNRHKTGPLPAFLLSLIVASMVIGGCGQRSETAVSGAEEASNALVKPEERPYVDASRPFAEAIASRDYLKAYDCLSSHAKARLSQNQFVAPADDAVQIRNETSAVLNATPEQFIRMMSTTEAEYGKPSKVANLSVFSTSPVALGGTGTSVEDKMESMFAIGMMPATIPVDIRKASVRSKLMVELSSEKLAEVAKAEETTPEKLKTDPDFQPYITLKMVLVEDAGALKVGYFEFLPPGIWD